MDRLFRFKLPARGVKIPSRRRTRVWLKAAERLVHSRIDRTELDRQILNLAAYGTSHPEILAEQLVDHAAKRVRAQMPLMSTALCPPSRNWFKLIYDAKQPHDR